MSVVIRPDKESQRRLYFPMEYKHPQACSKCLVRWPVGDACSSLLKRYLWERDLVIAPSREVDEKYTDKH
ncbi:hypothetical protein TNCV_3015501 [Trichonephila clavipes]|nr:hypothetical protein TNCV_3015501 [Trichonephila clavipes]